LHKSLWFNDKWNNHPRFCTCAEDLARMLITAENEGEYTDEQKNAPAAESVKKRPKRRKR